MTINFWAVLVSAIVVMILGFVWHGPLFGKKFMGAMGMPMPTDPEVRKQMMKGMNMIYGMQFLLFLFQVWILAKHITYVTDVSAVGVAICLWAGFVMPTVASAAMWTNRPSKDKWTIFLVSAGFNLVALGVAGFIIGAWH